jgi:hypothetical protein
MALIDEIPGLGGLAGRYFDDGRTAGIMYVDKAFVTLAGYDIKLPTSIQVAPRKEVKIRTNSGLDDPVVIINPSITIDVNLVGMAGNWRKSPMSSLGGIAGVPMVGGIADAAVGMSTMLLGYSEFIKKIEMIESLFNILYEAGSPVEIKDDEGFLAAFGVTAVVPISFSASSVPEEAEIPWSMRLVKDSDIDPVTVIFPEENA